MRVLSGNCIGRQHVEGEDGSHENGIVNSFIYSRMEKIKTKVRFTSLDVAAMVQNLQRLIGMR